MKKVLAVIVILILSGGLNAQENLSLDWDIDSLFTEDAFNENSFNGNGEESISDTGETTVMQMINRRGLTFSVSYGFTAAIYPGWIEPPWHNIDMDEYEDKEYSNFSWNPGAKLSTSFGMDAQISEIFRVLCYLNFLIPDGNRFSINLGDFFFDYNFLNTVYLRGGKYSLKWGISPNFGFTNLLNRVTETGNTYDSFILKADIPVGVGGFQFLALTRANMLGGENLNREKIGFGGKYNLALRRMDLDAGAFYHYGMPSRGFVSLKTTLGNTEVYTEGLLALDSDEAFSLNGAFNFGFAHDFFDNRLSLNGEFFYNTETNTFWYSSQTYFEDAKTSAFIDGLNMAINLLYRFGGKGNPRVFLQTLYAARENSARLVPGFRLSPWSHIDMYMAFPMSLGSKEGYYYNNTVTNDRYGNPHRFAMILMFNLRGSLRFTHYSQN